MTAQLDYLFFFALSGLIFGGMLLSARTGVPRSARYVGVALLLPLLVGGWFITERAGNEARQSIVRMLTGYAPTYAADFEALGHQSITPSTSPDDPVYLRLIESEKRWLRVNRSVNDIYTFRRDADGTQRLIVDSETDYNHNGRFDSDKEQRTAIGEVYEDSNRELRAAYKGDITFQSDAYTDKWGTWVSAYAPIHDSRGHVEGVLGVDFDARDWNGAIRRARLTVIGYLFAVVLVVSAGVYLFGAMQRNQELAVQGSRAKGEFLATMSHEIRTPMNGVSSMALLLLDTSLNENQREFAQTIKSSADSLLAIINDILDFSKIEAGKMTLDPVAFDFERACSDVVSLLSGKAKEKGLELSLLYGADAPRRVVGDPVRLRQIVLNLTGNAIKFTAKGHVRVHVTNTGGAGGTSWVRVAVEDTGIGIPLAAQSLVFEKFTQADGSTTRNFGGTGLGLSISRQLIQLMGADLQLKSEEGVGSTFFFTLALPIAEADPGQVGQAIEPPMLPISSLGYHVLLVEDNEVNQRVARHLLKKLGCTVDVAGNGRIALEMLSANTGHHIVLMDCHMPEMDGFDATRAWRQREAGASRIPIVAMTANAMQGDRERCLEAGMDDYITKPVPPAELARVVAHWGAIGARLAA